MSFSSTNTEKEKKSEDVSFFSEKDFFESQERSISTSKDSLVDSYLVQNSIDCSKTEKDDTLLYTKISQNRKIDEDLIIIEGSKMKKLRSGEEVLAIQGPSRSNKKCSKSESLDDIEFMSNLLLKSAERMKALEVCLACECNISEHVNMDKGISKFKCCLCKYSCVKEDFLLIHVSREHLSDPFYCTICDVWYSKVGIHENLQTCNICAKKFRCITELEDHYLIHEKYLLKVCRICLTSLEKHSIKEAEEKIFKCCKGCTKDFKTKNILREHLYIHPDLNLFKCDLCGTRYKQKKSLSRHSKTHPSCITCGRDFVDANSLKAHRLKIHR